MTTSLTLSASSQNIVAETASAEAQRLRAGAKKSLWWSLGGFAASVALAAAFPPSGLAGLGVIIAGTIGGISGLRAAGRYATAKTLDGVKEGVKKEGFVDKFKKRTAALCKLSRRADRLSDYALYGSLAAAAVALLVPPVAAVAWAAYSLGIYTMGVGLVTRIATEAADRSLPVVNLVTQELALKDALVPPANNNTPPASGLSSAPSPSKPFDKAVNGPAPEAAAPVPVKAAPPPPKP